MVVCCDVMVMMAPVILVLCSGDGCREFRFELVFVFEFVLGFGFTFGLSLIHI